MKYTDIDYYVFTDAARYVATSHSPYDRETYRYTPILSWLLLPTTWHGSWFSFGKALFALSDIITGWIIVLVLRTTGGMPMDRALKFASIWLLNPMVATISTRGSSEGLLAAMVVALVWAVMQRRIVLASVLLGVGVHFKIYPFIYAPSILWWLDDEQMQLQPKTTQGASLWDRARRFCNRPRITLAFLSFGTFVTLNWAMYYIVFSIHSAAISLCHCASASVGEERPTVNNVGTNLFVRDLQQSLYEPVLPLVHGVPPILSSHIVFNCVPANWHNGTYPVGFNTSHVAPTGL
ncbi:hypothetical protein V496_00400 [Pseudogymnoascus sp. VKM F-4515 (FW-2607)]|nr:hypothetical protein V496_00400 [Pseudogymnoascus sp. VKM F-4515 (FW-2607)]KFY95735.1 hypothetical protein V498_03177 [Pseudogymnoascus sp. VKM F-4517 (FW-2822)]